MGFGRTGFSVVATGKATQGIATFLHQPELLREESLSRRERPLRALRLLKWWAVRKSRAASVATGKATQGIATLSPWPAPRERRSVATGKATQGIATSLLRSAIRRSADVATGKATQGIATSGRRRARGRRVSAPGRDGKGHSGHCDVRVHVGPPEVVESRRERPLRALRLSLSSPFSSTSILNLSRDGKGHSGHCDFYLLPPSTPPPGSSRRERPLRALRLRGEALLVGGELADQSRRERPLRALRLLP